MKVSLVTALYRPQDCLTLSSDDLQEVSKLHSDLEAF